MIFYRAGWPARRGAPGRCKRIGWFWVWVGPYVIGWGWE